MKAYEQLKLHCQQIADIRAATALFSWDQEVMMPIGGGPRRARQIGTLAGIHHRYIMDIEPLLSAAEKQHGLSELEQKNIQQIRRDFDRAKKIPQSLVIQIAQSASEANYAWEIAKKNSNFLEFAPSLEKMVRLKQQEAETIGYSESPYDALAEGFEPGMKASIIQTAFQKILPYLKTLVQRILSANSIIDDHFLYQPIAKNQQLTFVTEVIQQLGYRFENGRQDLSTHPFTINFAPEDVRITTKYVENDILSMLYSSIHETGHAIYEQSLNPEEYGMPAAEACSLSIHESQSRIWENNIARSLPFWQFWFPKFASLFPKQLSEKTAEDVFRAINKVQPSLIRIEADELTYHFHILIRFELELALIEGKLKVLELPEYWNAKV
ncbi:MAG: carboxypeptidase M32, partial [Bacteroidia bacterium]|nr:carboxypeptidase M32 [Bacteroidia bacterium]